MRGSEEKEMGTKGLGSVAGIWEVRLSGSHLRGNVCEPAQGAFGSDTGGPPRSFSGAEGPLEFWLPLDLERMGSTEDLEICRA